jgi:hypothetical protein
MTNGDAPIQFWYGGKFTNDLEMPDPKPPIVFSYTPDDGLKVRASKLAFFGATPVSKPASASQAAVSGTAGATYTATEQAMLNDLKTLANALRDALVQLGLIKGSA